MFTVDNLSIETKKGRKLVDKLSFNLNEGDKMAIIGEEGNGKSTLLKALIDPMLVSEYCVVTGSVNKPNISIGYLEQKLSNAWNDYSPIDYFLKQTPDTDFDYERYNEFHKFEHELKKLGFDVLHLSNDTLIKNLSGGEKVKLQLAKLIVQDPDVYFFDEPTNDLDIDTLEKLEDFIKSTNKPIIYISHDETLLENTANKILHIEQLIRKTKPKFTLQKCSYREYIDARSRQIEHQTQVAYSERRERDKKEEVLRQIKQKVENALIEAKKDPSSGRIIAKKMANVKAQEKRLENEDLTELPNVEEAINIVVDKSITLPAQKVVLSLDLPKLFAGKKQLSKNIQLQVKGPQKVAIIGKNGCGKTTLLKKIVPILQQTTGLKVGYFSQNYNEILNYSNTALDEMQASSKDFNPGVLLGSLKFTRDEMLQKVESLSEGQKAKLAILKLIVEKNNVLVLDEPTRNLSPLSNPVIRQILQSYNGAIITVSHDRKFISEVCNSVYELDNNGLTKRSFVLR